MKRSLLFILAICIIAGNHLNGQGLLKKVAKSMTNELMGKPEEVDRGPEPTSACKDAKLVVDLGGKLQIDYTEVSISVRDDGAILMKYRITGEYYVAKDGVTQGPFKAGDKRLAGFEIADESFNPTSEEEDEKKQDEWITKYGQYISRKGEKYTITFEGKTYGPYAMINSFAVPRSKDKFAANRSGKNGPCDEVYRKHETKNDGGRWSAKHDGKTCYKYPRRKLRSGKIRRRSIVRDS